MPIAASSTRPLRFSARWRARDITDPRFEKGCEGVAQQIQGHIGGDIITIRLSAPPGVSPQTVRSLRLGPYRGHAPGERGWAYHQVVVREGRVYDAFTGHKGETIEEYKKHWIERAGINFGF
jgi:hypothetical protein